MEVRQENNVNRLNADKYAPVKHISEAEASESFQRQRLVTLLLELQTMFVLFCQE